MRRYNDQRRYTPPGTLRVRPTPGIASIYQTLLAGGITLHMEGNSLIVQTPSGVVAWALRAHVTRHEAALIEHIRGMG